MFIKEITEKLVWLTETEIIDYTKIITKISVRWILVNNENKIALIKGKGMFSLPWGSTDNQSIESAFKREMKEEVGADIQQISHIGITREYRYFYDTPMLIQSHVYVANILGTLGNIQLEEEEIEEWHVVERYTYDEMLSLYQKELLSRTEPRDLFVLYRDIAILEEYAIYQKNTWSQDSDTKLKDAEEIAKKAQYDYIMLKGEFDSYVRRVEWDNKEAKVQQLVDLTKKLTPIIDQLGQSVSHMPADLQENTWAAGVKLTYDNAIKILQGLGINLIPTIGHEPDMELHEPLSVEPTDDESLKWKIIKEFQPWYVYEKDGVKKVVTAAKVIVGQ